MAGGDTYTIIYLKMQLLAMKTDGVLTFTGLESDFADELALDLDEDPMNVKATLVYLISCGLCETSDNISYLFPWARANTGSEGASAKRMRDMRDRQASLCDASVTQALRLSDGEKEIEKEKEIESEKENKSFTHSFTQNEKLPSMVKMLKGYKERGWDTASVYGLAESYGISRAELEARCE